MNLNFWHGKKVFLTGHTGFKGGWLSLWLQSLGAEITGYSLKPSSSPNLFDEANVGANMVSIIGDIRDLNNIQRAMIEARPDIVIHMAAQSLVRYSYLNPVETYETNVMGTVNLFEAVRNCKSIKAVVNVTSDKCYENREWSWGYRENDAMGGYDPYSNSKGCAELVTSSYRSSFFNVKNYNEHGVAIASARAGNVIGGGDWSEDRLIPDFIRAITLKKNMTIRNPHALRPWQNVLEPLRGYLVLAEKLFVYGNNFAGAWNFGPIDSDVQSVDWIVNQFVNSWGSDAKFTLNLIEPNLHEANFLKLDCSKAKADLGWEPLWGLSDTINKIADWHKAHLNGVDMNTYSLNEIKQYEADICKLSAEGKRK